MTQLSDNLESRRTDLHFTVKYVVDQLARRGYVVAYSTVAGWFNGNRGIREMDHLKTLCDILQTDMNAMTGGHIALPESRTEVLLLDEVRDLTDAQKEALVAIARSMKTR